MNVSRWVVVWLVGAALVGACGGGSATKATAPTAAPGSATPTVRAVAASTATPLPGDAPGSPATAALDRAIQQTKVPGNMSVLGRRDLTNESEARGDAAQLQQFKDGGRETGALYVISVDGAARVQLGINQYATPQQARAAFAAGKSTPKPEDAINVAGLGEDASGARVSPSGGQQGTFNVITFVRGRYWVTMADFVGDPSVSAEPVVGMLRSLDGVLKAGVTP